MESLSAAAILERVAAVYAAARTYQDTGVVRTTFQTPQRTWSKEMPFNTAFERANLRFRFEFDPPTPGPAADADPERRWIIWREREHLEQRSALTRAPAATFRLAIASATGVSKGAAHRIPALLMPAEVGGRRLTDEPEQAARIEDAALAAGECFRIRRSAPRGSGVTSETVWILQESFLIHRIDTRRSDDDSEIESVTRYEPLMNAPIPAVLTGRPAPETAPAARASAEAAALPDKRFIVCIDEIQQNFVFGEPFSGHFTRTVELSDGSRRTIELTAMLRDGAPLVELRDGAHRSYMGPNGTTTHGRLMIQLRDYDAMRADGETRRAALMAASPVLSPEISLLSLPELVPSGFAFGLEIFNDNTTPMNFVIDVLISVAGMDPRTANHTMLEIHRRGGALLPTASRQEAEQLAARISAEANKQAYPLLCRAVEMPA